MNEILDIELLDALILVVIFSITTTINAFVCYLVWLKRASGKAMVKTFDKLLSQTQVGKSLITISGAIKTVNVRVLQIETALAKLNLPPITVDSIVEKVKEAIPPIDEDSIVGKMWRRLRGQAGGNQAALNSEIKALEGDVASVVEEVYPGVMWMGENLDLLVDTGLIDIEKANSFKRAANHPTVLPTLEKGCLFLKKKFDNLVGTTVSTDGKNTGRPKF